MKSIAARLKEYLGTDSIVLLDRKPIDPYDLAGFVVGMSENLLLLQVVDENTLTLNGYTALSLQDVRSAIPRGGFRSRALRLLSRTPVVPDELDVSDWGTLLDSAKQNYPLVSIEQETIAPRCVFAGRIVRQTAKSVDLEKISPDAGWGPIRKYKFKDITRITLDDAYLRVLPNLVSQAAEDPAEKSRAFKQYRSRAFRLRQTTSYLICHAVESNDPREPDTVVMNDQEQILTFDSLDHAKEYADRTGLDVEDNEWDMLLDLDVLSLWLAAPRKSGVNCNVSLGAWNLFSDVLSTLKGKRAHIDNGKAHKIYDKLFFGTNNPAVTMHGGSYVPNWTRSEIDQLQTLLSKGMRLFIEHLAGKPKDSPPG